MRKVNILEIRGKGLSVDFCLGAGFSKLISINFNESPFYHKKFRRRSYLIYLNDGLDVNIWKGVEDETITTYAFRVFDNSAVVDRIIRMQVIRNVKTNNISISFGLYNVYDPLTCIGLLHGDLKCCIEGARFIDKVLREDIFIVRGTTVLH